MNWTGGNLQRSKNKNNAVVERQKSHFAKVRSKTRHRSNASSHDDWDPGLSTRSSPSRQKPKSRWRHQQSPRIQQWKDSAQTKLENTKPTKYAVSHRSDVEVRIGQRAFASQPRTTAATPSVMLPRPETVSSEPMLLDGFDQPNSDIEQTNASSSFGLQSVNSLDHEPIVLSKESSLLRQTTSPLLAVSTMYSSSKDNQTQKSFAQPVFESLGLDAADQDEENCEAPSRESFVSPRGVVPMCDSHSTLSSNEDDTEMTWRRFAHDDKSSFIGDGFITIPPSSPPPHRLVHTDTQQISLQQPYSRSSRLSWPTNRACLLGTEAGKQKGGVMKKQTQDSEDDVWKKFVLGSQYTDEEEWEPTSMVA